jgi:hypothetical protein
VCHGALALRALLAVQAVLIGVMVPATPGCRPCAPMGPALCRGAAGTLLWLG